MIKFFFNSRLAPASTSTDGSRLRSGFPFGRWCLRAGRASALAACLMTAATPFSSWGSEPSLEPSATAEQSVPDWPTAENASPFSSASESPTQPVGMSRELEAAVRDLSHASAAVRMNALERISWMGADAEPALLDVTFCLDDPQPEVRAYAAKTLWDLDRQSALAAVNTLRDMVDSTQPGVRPLAAFYLGYIGPDAASALPTLKRALANTESTEQLQIAEAVARINPQDPDAVSVLIGGLRDPESQVRFQAAYALGEVSPIHAKQVIPELATAMKDQSPQVRQAAELAMGSFSSELLAKPPADVQPTAESPAIEENQPPTESSPVTLLDPEPILPMPVVALLAEPVAEREDYELVSLPADTVHAPPPKDNRLGLGEDYRPITSLNISITPKRRDEEGKLLPLPTNYGAAWLQDVGSSYQPIGVSRPWIVQSVQFAASGFCHRPLYFEEINLERYGHNFGCTLQPFVSAGAFFGRVPFLPYLLIAEPHCECQYTLGHYRSGNCVPYRPSHCLCFAID